MLGFRISGLRCLKDYGLDGYVFAVRDRHLGYRYRARVWVRD